MRIIKKDDKVIAIVFDGQFQDGTTPITDGKWPLQIISLKYPKGKIWPGHYHKPMTRTTEGQMEALIIISGSVKVSIYFEKDLVEVLKLNSGQGVMLVNSGFGMEVLEDAEMLEFKNGPFVEDKIVFE
ncbi:MAG: hypothetical protein UW50_C0001G0245 [Candidatus Wolfebacteria bacterium GW2011_GWA1_44_24]|uniref:Uncharacterized protein n=1 Tax=Candidatus Wolfebacteria bacterium GW2011_GWB1_41_12 TaxID=1619006 RepID=A0A0G0WXM5_9BACT|nr:MAG: hypothetical protein UU38_C0001G0057 [Candidatus Wolfebacteria bacterium GW2011_GWB1_41_12]KKT56676.1 MAG: hypothetical protein UW50_C0001G0245 [Candidatus Wolfebacteria bacterium GW2011_GWA1_44_24]